MVQVEIDEQVVTSSATNSPRFAKVWGRPIATVRAELVSQLKSAEQAEAGVRNVWGEFLAERPAVLAEKIAEAVRFAARESKKAHKRLEAIAHLGDDAIVWEFASWHMSRDLAERAYIRQGYNVRGRVSRVVEVTG